MRSSVSSHSQKRNTPDACFEVRLASGIIFFSALHLAYTAYRSASIAEGIKRRDPIRLRAHGKPVGKDRCDNFLREFSVLPRIKSAGGADTHPSFSSSRINSGNLILGNTTAYIRRRKFKLDCSFLFRLDADIVPFKPARLCARQNSREFRPRWKLGRHSRLCSRLETFRFCGQFHNPIVTQLHSAHELPLLKLNTIVIDANNLSYSDIRLESFIHH